jgi:hypothetical protein
MTGIWDGAGFFAFVLTGVVVAGYCTSGSPSIAAWRARQNRPAIGSQFAFGGRESLPVHRREFSGRQEREKSVSHAAHRGRIPLAGGVADFLRHQVRQRAVFRRAGRNPGAGIPHEPSLTPIPMICGLGLGFLLPDRVLTRACVPALSGCEAQFPRRWT